MTLLRRLSALCLILSLAGGLAVIQPAGLVHAASTTLNCPTFAQLSGAISTSSSGDTIGITCATADTITFTTSIPISHSVTIDSSGSVGQITLDGGGTTQLFALQTGGSPTLSLIGGDQPDIPAVAGRPAVPGTTLELAHATHGLPPTDASCGADNSADTAGGAIFVGAGTTLDLTNTTFTSNAVCAYGGAIADFGGTLNITGSTFKDNTTSAAGGGAIDIEDGEFSGATATITGSTFWGNSVVERGSSQGGSGGAIAIERGSSPTTLSVTNSTFFGNTAFSSAGAIFAFNGAGVSVTNSTFANNSATFGGGTFATQLSAPITLANSIIAAPQSDQQGCEAASDITDEGYNITDGPSSNCLSGKPGDLITNPQLEGLNQFGGPTLTMAPGPTSPAIDHIPVALCPASDQRGNTRPDDSESFCDVGAVEFDFSIPTPTITQMQPMSVSAGASNTTVTLTGTKFFPGATVQYTPSGGSAISLPASVSEEDLTSASVTIPASALSGLPQGGNGTVTISLPPDGATSNSETLTINPTITAVGVEAGDHAPAGGAHISSGIETSTTDVTLDLAGKGFCDTGTACHSSVMMAINSGTPFPLTITGSGFTSSTDGLAATIPHADLVAGDTIHIFVSNADGGQSDTVDLAVADPTLTPTLSQISPIATEQNHPNAVQLTLTGTNFQSGVSQVTFGGIDTLSGGSVSNGGTTLTVTVPASDLTSAQDVPVSVTNPPGAPGGYTDGGTTSPQTFHIDAPPSITSLSLNPMETSTTDGSLTINGSGFCDASSPWCQSTVTWSDSSAGSPYTLQITSFSSTQLVVTIPKALIGDYNGAQIQVTNADGGQSSQVQEVVLRPNPVPVLSSISVSAVSAGSGDLALTLSGSGFVATSVVELSPSDCAPNGLTPDSIASTTLHVTIPAACTANPASFTVDVRTPPAAQGFADGGTSGTQPLTVDAAPTLSSLSSDTLETSTSSASITLTGDNFLNGATIIWTFNGSDTPLTTVWDSRSELTATVSSDLLGSTGTATVRVLNPDNGVTPTLPVQLVAPNPAATLSGLSENSATEGDPDQPITLTGSNFVNGADVQWTFNGVSQSLCSLMNPCDVMSPDTITATIPAGLLGTAGSATLAVVNPPAVSGYNDGGATATRAFTINNPVPSVSGASPNGIAIGAAGTTITITGAGFTSTSTVKWNTSNLSTTYVSPTQLKAGVPSSLLTATAAGLLTVTNPGPGGGTSAPAVIEVTKTGASTAESAVGAGSAGLDGASGTPASLNATTNGGGLVAVAKYTAAPGTATFNNPKPGTYFDVYLQPVAPSPTTATIVDCTLNGGNTAYYQDPTTFLWKPVSSQSQTPSGCITMTITNSTSPSLGQMHATAFGIGGDVTAPVTTAKTSTTPNSSGVYLRPITVTLTAADNSGGSGVATIHYALPNGGTSCASATYTAVAGSTATVSITQPVNQVNVIHTLCYYAQDSAGNNEAAHTATYKIDTTERVIQTAHAAFSNASGLRTVSVSAQPGDLLVAVLTYASGSSLTNPTLTAGGQSFSLDAAPSPRGTKTQALIFHASPTAAVTSVGITTPAYTAYDVWVFDVANPSSSLVNAQGASFATASKLMSISTSGATTAANDFVVAASINDGATAPGAPAGYTSPTTLAGSVTKSRVVYSLTNSPGTQTANFGSLTTAADIGLAIAAYGGP